MMKTVAENIKSIATILIIVFAFAILEQILWLCHDDKATVSQIILAVVGTLGTVTGYYYGYSQGASKKDEAQANQIANSKTTIETPNPEAK